MSKELFQLVTSLSKGEKRAIVISAEKTDGDKNFLELYYALIKQKEYNEEQLLKDNKGKGFSKHFGFSKNYLQNFILKELRAINADYKVSIRCKNYLIDIELLFWRGQFKLAIKLINQAKLLAEKYEYQLILEELYYWERRIITSGSMKIPKVINYSQDMRFKIMDSYFNQLEYKKLINDVTFLLKESEEVRDEDDLKKVNDIKSNELLVNKSKAKSKKAEYDFYILNAALARLVGDFNSSINYHKQLKEFIKDNNHIFIEENPIFYLATCNNVMLHALQSGNIDLYNETYKEVAGMQLKEEYSKAYYDTRILIFVLGSAVQNKTYSLVKNLITSTTVFSEDLITDVVRLLLNYYGAVINFYCNDFKESLIFINRILNNQKQIRVDVIGTTLIFNILVHYELNHFEYIEAILGNHIKFLKKNRLLSLYDATFIKGIGKIAETQNKVEAQKLFIEIKNHLFNMKNKKSYHHEIDYIDWINKKIGN